MTPRKPVNCPRCESELISWITYGLPGPELMDDAIKGDAILGGCDIKEDMPNWHCRDCKFEWYDISDPWKIWSIKSMHKYFSEWEAELENNRKNKE